MLEENKNYYDILEVPHTASLQDIRSAYQKVKNAYNGDSAALYSLMNEEDCNRILVLIEEAYGILGNPEKRREYDHARGFNHTMTPNGYLEEINAKPSYKPMNPLDELVKETELKTDMLQNDRSDFEYSHSQSSKAEVGVSKVAAFKKFGLNYIEDNDFEQQIENCTLYTGDFLKQVREYKNVTIERMAEMTKISKSYIRNIEEDAHEKLPAIVYTRGFVYQYAKCLKLNPDLVATSYLHHLKKLKAPENAV